MNRKDKGGNPDPKAGCGNRERAGAGRTFSCGSRISCSIFLIAFFDNQNEIGVKVPLRSWKLKSDADGVVRMDEAHLISGDPFF